MVAMKHGKMETEQECQKFAKYWMASAIFYSSYSFACACAQRWTPTWTPVSTAWVWWSESYTQASGNVTAYISCALFVMNKINSSERQRKYVWFVGQLERKVIQYASYWVAAKIGAHFKWLMFIEALHWKRFFIKKYCSVTSNIF